MLPVVLPPRQGTRLLPMRLCCSWFEGPPFPPHITHCCCFPSPPAAERLPTNLCQLPAFPPGPPPPMLRHHICQMGPAVR